MGKKGTPHRKWSAAEKERIVKRHLEEHVSLRQLEVEEGAGNALIGSWVKRYLAEGVAGLEARNGNPYAALHTSKHLSELDRLRLTVAKQEVELARLKKGYWVEGVGENKVYITGGGVTLKSSKR